jgi:type III secretion translocon protein HrpF
MRVNEGSRATGAGGSGQSSAAAEAAERAAREAQRAAEAAARAAAEAARAQAAAAAEARARAEAAAKQAQEAAKQAQAALAQAKKENVPRGDLTRVEQAVARANTSAQQAATSARSAGGSANNASSFTPAQAANAQSPQRQPPAGPPGVTPGYTREQAARDATELYRATKGGLTGWGTDEAAIFRTLDKRTPADIALIRQSFREHYNLDLDSTLREELSGNDLTRANNLLSGNRGNAGAAAIQQQTGWFGDKDAIVRTLQQASPSERQAIARSFQQMYGKDHRDIQASSPEEFMRKALEPGLNDAQRTQLRGLLATTSATAPEQVAQLEAGAARSQVNDALQGFFGADSKKVFDTIQGLPPEQRQLLLADTALQAEMQKKLSREDYTRARGLLEGNTAAASAAQIRSATQGWFGPDKNAIIDVLRNTKPEELPALQAEFQRQTGRSLESEVRGWGGNDAAVALRYLNPPAANDRAGQARADAERLHRAMDGLGTDEAALREVLGNKSKQQINDISTAYRELYGKDLRATLDSELGGRDKFEILNQMYDLGAVDMSAPDAAQQQVARLRAQQQFEQSGGLGIIDTVQTWTKGESDSARLERNLDAAEAAIASGNTEAANRRVGYSTDDIQDVQEAKDTAADVASTAAVVVATTAAVVATGGAATPLAVAGYAALGAGTRVATQAYFKGDSLGTDGLLQQGALGAVEGATAVIPVPKALGGGGVVAAEGAEQAVKQTVGQRLRSAAIQGAWEGGVGSATSGAVDQALRSETWQNGLVSGLAQVGNRAVRDGTIGTVFGAGTGVATDGIMQGVSRATRPREVPVTSNPDLPGDTTRVRYDNGRVRIETGPHATAAQVQAHLETARALQKYEGPLGQIRQLRDRIQQTLTGTPGYGTAGFEARLEVKKLKGMLAELDTAQRQIDERIRTMGGRPDSATVAERAAINRDIADLEVQLRVHQNNVDSLAPGRGFVDKYSKQALEEFSAVTPQLNAIETMLKSPGVDQAPLVALIDRAADLQRQGKLTGVEDWIRETANQAATGNKVDVLARFTELGTALRTAGALPHGQQVALAPRAATTPGSPVSFASATQPAGGAVRTQGPHEIAARAGLTPQEQGAFDIWADRMFRNKGAAGLEDAIEKMQSKDPNIIKGQLKGIVYAMEEQERFIRHATNLGDPVHPQLAQTTVRDGITIHYEASIPEPHEILQAKNLQTARGEPVVLFGDDATKSSYPGIDGTIGDPPRPMQLKRTPDPDLSRGNTAWAARSQAMAALEKAKKHNIRDVELYIESPQWTRAELQANWSKPDATSVETPGPVFDQDYISRIEIAAKDGRMEVLLNADGVTYTFRNL